jgi:hypothetical protein
MGLLPPQGFGPRGPKPEEAYIAKTMGGVEVPAKHKLLKLSRLEATEFIYYTIKGHK